MNKLSCTCFFLKPDNDVIFSVDIGAGVGALVIVIAVVGIVCCIRHRNSGKTTSQPAQSVNSKSACSQYTSIILYSVWYFYWTCIKFVMNLSAPQYIRNQMLHLPLNRALLKKRIASIFEIVGCNYATNHIWAN